MDNSNFLSFFNGLNEKNPKEIIVQNAENLVNMIELTSPVPIKQTEKLKDYLNICKNSSEDLLYTLRRLIGGLGSTGIEYRLGFTLALSLLINKFGASINATELLNCIQKETFVPKSETNHVKICAMSGRLLLLKIVLSIKGLSIENIIFILREIFALSSIKSMEESMLQTLSECFQKIFGNYYTDIKKANKLYEGLLKLIEPLSENKNKLHKCSMLEFSIYIILLQYEDNFKRFLPTNLKEEMFRDNGEDIPIVNYISFILASPVKGTEFHVSFSLLCECLIKLNEQKYPYKIWNILIDQKWFSHFQKISSKNCEIFLYKYSSYLLNNYYNINYVSQIFDDSFFLSLLNFATNKKSKYASEISSILIENLAKESKDNILSVQDYCSKLIKIFGPEQKGKYSPNGFRLFFLFCFNHLKEKEQNDYIDSIISNESNSDDIEEELFHISAFKILFLNINNEEYKDKILEYFLIKLYSSERSDDIEFEHLVEERSVLLVISLFKPIIEVVNGKNELIHVNDAKAVKALMGVHKKIQSLIKNKKIEISCKNYMKYYKEFTSERSKNDSKKGKKLSKLGFVTLLLYIKNERDYEQEMIDILHIKQFDSQWMQVYTDLTLSILHKGNSKNSRNNI